MNMTGKEGEIVGHTGVIARYRSLLPVEAGLPIVTLGEGSTPLIECSKLAAAICFPGRVFVKCEGLNPTGSFKDRGMTVAVTKAKASGARALLCASTGNTSASAAAYAARAGLTCAVVLPAGKIATGKMVQAIAHGARIVSIDGNFDDALRLVRELGASGEFSIVNSINPDRIAGQKTAAFEIVDQLGEAPFLHLLPLGNAGNISAYWAGYRHYYELGRSKSLPLMVGVQAEGAAPIFRGYKIDHPETVASAIRIGNPASWGSAETAVQESGGGVEIASDAEILHAQEWLARHEGIFVEPASAAPIAALLQLGERRFQNQSFPSKKTAIIVCTVTGHGLKDPEIIAQRFSAEKTVAAEREAVRAAILT
ncbi:MAG: threonine synthase [Verrucomicrobiota bacterium]